MQNRQLEHDNGWIWHKSWEQPGESLLSCLLKLSWANDTQAGELSLRLFGSTPRLSFATETHPRSLLLTDWTERFPPQSCPDWIKRVAAESRGRLSHCIGNLGTDKQIRYCLDCLSKGVHYSEFQIEGLRNCPIHQTPLRISCTTCGALTPRCALCKETFDAPFYCVHCGNPLAGEMTPSKLVVSPVTQDRGGSMLKERKEWVSRVSKLGLKWVEGDNWVLTELESHPMNERRLIFFLVALQACPFPSRQSCDIKETSYWQTWPVGLTSSKRIWPSTVISKNALDRRISIYKAIRRYFYKRYLRQHKSCWRSARNGDLFGSLDWKDLPNANICVWAQTWMLWRSRFEDPSMAADLWNHGWRNVGQKRIYKGAICDPDIGDLECAVTVLYCFHASFRTLRIWILSRWQLVSQGAIADNSREFFTTPAPFLQLVSVQQRNLEVQVAAIFQPASHSLPAGEKFLIGANESGYYLALRCVCNPFFPRC